MRAAKGETTKSMYSCVVEAQGTDIYPNNQLEIERCYTQAAHSIGFTVLKFQQALSTALKRPQNFYYVDQRPTDGEVPSSFFKAFKYIRGPKGNLMKIKFNNGLDKAYKTLCFGGPGCVEGGCLKDAQHECDCSKNNKKRGTDSSGGEREASQRRRMGALEDAFGA